MTDIPQAKCQEQAIAEIAKLLCQRPHGERAWPCVAHGPLNNGYCDLSFKAAGHLYERGLRLVGGEAPNVERLAAPASCSPICPVREAAQAIEHIAVALGPSTPVGALVPISSPDWQRFREALAAPCGPQRPELPEEPSEAAVDRAWWFHITRRDEPLPDKPDFIRGPLYQHVARTIEVYLAAERRAAPDEVGP